MKVCIIYNTFKNKLISNLCLIHIYDYKWFPHRLTVRAKKFQVMEFNYEGIPGKE